MSEATTEIICFSLGSSEYAFDTSGVDSIIKTSKITPIPKAPPLVDGMINVRGEMIPIINTTRCFDQETIEPEYNNIILIKTDHGTLGFLVTFVTEISRLEANQVSLPPRLLQEKSKFISGVVQLNDDNNKSNRLIHIVDVNLIEDLAMIKDQTKDFTEEIDLATNNKTSSSETNEQINTEPYIIFAVGEQEYGFHLDEVDSIRKVKNLEPFSDTSSPVVGMMQADDRIIPMIDLAFLFGLREKMTASSQRGIIIKYNGMMAGIIVDIVHDIVRIPNNSINQVPSMISQCHLEFLSQIARLEDQKKEKAIFLMTRESFFTAFSKDRESLLQTNQRGEEETLVKEQKVIGKEHIIFRIAQSEFALPLDQVDEVLRFDHIAKVPKMPDFVRGILTHRGQVIPIIQTSTRIGIADEESDNNKMSRIIIVKHKQEQIGLLVDEVKEVCKIRPDEIKPQPAIIQSHEGRFSDGVAERIDTSKGEKKSSERHQMILNLEKVLEIGDLISSGQDSADHSKNKIAL